MLQVYLTFVANLLYVNARSNTSLFKLRLLTGYQRYKSKNSLSRVSVQSFKHFPELKSLGRLFSSPLYRRLKSLNIFRLNSDSESLQSTSYCSVINPKKRFQCALSYFFVLPTDCFSFYNAPVCQLDYISLGIYLFNMRRRFAH